MLLRPLRLEGTLEIRIDLDCSLLIHLLAGFYSILVLVIIHLAFKLYCLYLMSKAPHYQSFDFIQKR
jgi:hypothetical protein